MRHPESLPLADALPPEWGQDGELLRQALADVGVALPAVSADLLADQARLEALLADLRAAGAYAGAEDAAAEATGAGAAGALTDLTLLTDLIVVEGQVAAGTARAPSPAVLDAVCAAVLSVAALRAAGEGSEAGPESALPAAPLAAPLGAGASVMRAGGLRVLAARRAPRPGRWLAAAAAVLALCVGTWVLTRSAGSPSDASSASESSASEPSASAPDPASRNGTLAGSAGEGSSGGPEARAQVAPFVEARLWRRLAGRTLRGGEGLGLSQDPPAPGLAPQDVVLSWLPDAVSGMAARLRVHVSGPEGLVVLLPDLGVEAVLSGAARAAPDEGSALAEAGVPSATYVDFELPGGWAGQLAQRELRLAFRWPAPAVDGLATLEAHFDGVSLTHGQAVKGS